MDTPSGSKTLAALLITATLTTVGCASPDRADQPLADAPSVDRPPSSTSARPEADQEARMRIRITIGDHHFRATLTDSAASSDLAAQLPLTLDMVDHGSVEKTGPLPEPLSLDGQPEGADPDVGDVGYYAPGHDLVLYYGDQSYFPGIVILGRLDGDAAQRISELDGSVTATLERHAAATSTRARPARPAPVPDGRK
jgi:hypothetical protein